MDIWYCLQKYWKLLLLYSPSSCWYHAFKFIDSVFFLASSIFNFYLKLHIWYMFKGYIYKMHIFWSNMVLSGCGGTEFCSVCVTELYDCFDHGGSRCSCFDHGGSRWSCYVPHTPGYWCVTRLPLWFYLGTVLPCRQINTNKLSPAEDRLWTGR